MNDWNEPITGEWLLSVGMEKMYDEMEEEFQFYRCLIGLSGSTATYLVYYTTFKTAGLYVVDDGRSSDVIIIGTRTTRHEMRALFDALRPWGVVNEAKTNLYSDGKVHRYGPENIS